MVNASAHDNLMKLNKGLEPSFELRNRKHLNHLKQPLVVYGHFVFFFLLTIRA